MIGDGAEAETYLKWGKAISCSLNLPLFTVAFSSSLGIKITFAFFLSDWIDMLPFIGWYEIDLPFLWCVLPGKLYIKKTHWDLAEEELRSAEQILKESSTSFCCSKCKLKLEVTLYEYFGDLCQSKFGTCDGVMSKETAKNWYMSALDKLNLSEWKNPLSCPEDGNDGTATDTKCPAGKTCTCFIMKEASENINKSMKAGRETRKTKNAAKVLPKEPHLVVQNNTRVTRSRYRSSQSEDTSIYRKSEVRETLQENHVSYSSEVLSKNGSVLSKTDCPFNSRCPTTCVLSKMRCWYCLPSEVVKSCLLNDFINLKWEFVRRQLSMKLLSRVGMIALSHFLLYSAAE